MIEAGKLYPPVISDILENLASGDSVAVAVNKGFKSASYEAQLSDVTVGNTISASGAGLGEQLVLNSKLAPDYFLFTNFANGVNLSGTIHSGEAQAAVKETLNNYIKFKGNAQELTRKLTNINRFPNTDIPRELTKLIQLRKGFGDATESKAFKTQVKKAYASIYKLDARQVTQTRDLKKAYTKLITATQYGNAQQVETAINYAFNKKINYINSRIARTEFARSYEMSFQRQMEEDEAITGFEWVLSSAHPKVDICDCYAQADMYDMGAGIYPKGAGANIPAHSNCLCSKIPYYESAKNARYSQARVSDYLGNLSERDRKNVIGAKDSQYKKNYETGLKKQGFQITARPKMISKTIVKPKAD